MIRTEEIRSLRRNNSIAMLLTLIPAPSGEQLMAVSSLFLFGLARSGLPVEECSELPSLLDQCLHDVRSYLRTVYLESEPAAVIRSSITDELRRSGIRFVPEESSEIYALLTRWNIEDGLRYSHPLYDLETVFWDTFWLICASYEKLFLALTPVRISEPDPDRTEEALRSFLYNLSYLSERDGFLGELYSFFRTDYALKEIGYPLLHHLSDLQEQYNRLFDNRNNGIAEIGFDAHYVMECLNLTDIPSDHALIRIYVFYLRAETCRFIGAAGNAVVQFRNLLNEIDCLADHTLLRDRLDFRWLKICLHNAIGRSLTKADLPDRYCLARTEYEAILPLIRETDRFRPFLSICLKNYATCLENLSDYSQAIRQYEKVIELQTVAHRNYKLYDTYCSAVMKNWDKLYHKISENWLNNTRTLTLPADNYPISESLIDKLDMYLKVAERLKTELPNINIQRAKLNIYRMLSGLGDPETCLVCARKEISIADCLSVDKAGIWYIRRDLNYAEYLLTGDITRLKRASDINIRLKGRGDSSDFAELFSRLEH